MSTTIFFLSRGIKDVRSSAWSGGVFLWKKDDVVGSFRKGCPLMRKGGGSGRLLTEQGKAVAYHYETASVCLVLVINSLFFHIQIYEIFM